MVLSHINKSTSLKNINCHFDEFYFFKKLFNYFFHEFNLIYLKLSFLEPSFLLFDQFWTQLLNLFPNQKPTPFLKTIFERAKALRTFLTVALKVSSNCTNGFN